jgi:hypothetical protein
MSHATRNTQDFYTIDENASETYDVFLCSINAHHALSKTWMASFRMREDAVVFVANNTH